MDYKAIRKLSLKVFIGFLAFTALIAIVTVLSGDFGDTQMKILATTFTISAASICSMSCAAFIEKRRRTSLGLAGIFLCITGSILLIAGMWPEIDSDEYWKSTITVIVLAIAFAHAFLLLLPELDKKQKWVQRFASVSIGILAIQCIVAAWGEIENEDYYRFLAVVAIIVGLLTLVVPILMKLRKSEGKKQKLSSLDQVYGDIEARNMAIVRNVHEQVNKGNLEIFDEVLAPDYARHCQAMPPEAQEIRGAEPLKKFVKECVSAFPDWHDTVDLMFAAEDKVAYITTSRATQEGPLGDLPATGKRIELVSLIIQRLENGKIAETWISWDNVAFLTQLGHFPPTAAVE
jgi:steroid delta-isomerase-like uncharacterized protein